MRALSPSANSCYAQAMANGDLSPEVGARKDRRVILSTRQWRVLDAIAEVDRAKDEAKVPNLSRTLRRIVEAGLAAELGAGR